MSQLYRSPAWPDPAEPPFVNAVLGFERGPPAESLMPALHAVEAAFGRSRTNPNVARTLDLDILDYHGAISQAGDWVRLPHPRVADRDFALLPIADIVPGWRHPISGLTIDQLLSRLPHSAGAKPIGPIGLRP